MRVICARNKQRKSKFLCGNTAETADQEITRFQIQDHHDLMVCVCMITSVAAFETVRFKSYNTSHKNFLTHCHFLVKAVCSYDCYVHLHKVHTGNNLTVHMFKFLIFCSNKNSSHLIILCPTTFALRILCYMPSCLNCIHLNIFFKFLPNKILHEHWKWMVF
jgi:hypothetical protein